MKMSIHILLSIICIILVFDTPTQAVPTPPYPIVVYQPDGTPLTIRAIGDEYFLRYETLDGFTIATDRKGWWHYAVLNQNGKPIPGEHRVGAAGIDTTALKPHLVPTRTQYESIRSQKYISRYDRRFGAIVPPLTGNQKAVVVLMEFSDSQSDNNHQPFAHDTACFEDLLFTGSSGNVTMTKYFQQLSSNTLNIDGVGVVGWFKSTYTKKQVSSSLNGEIDWKIFEQFMSEAVDFADSVINFANADGTGDGYVDHFILVFAGSDSQGGDPNAPYTHMYWMSDKEVDGVKVSNYIFVAEESKVGFFCHETGHVLGAPDLYDNYPPYAYPAGAWCLMGRGCYNGPNYDGSEPSPMCGLLQVDVDLRPETGLNGWLKDVAILNDNGSYSLPALSGDDRKVYAVPLKGTGQFFILENRYKTGNTLDSSIPDSGLLIWHFDSSIPCAEAILYPGYDQCFFPNYGPPVTPYFKLWVERPSIVSSQDSIIAKAAFAADNQRTEFSPFTDPNSNTNEGSNSNMTITNISNSGPVMTFDLYLSGGSQQPVPDIKANGSDGPIFISSGTMVYVTVSLDPGDYASRKADWWVAVHTPFAPPFDWQSFVYPVGWMLGINLFLQTPLYELTSFRVVEGELLKGQYTFYFAVDDPDGIITGSWWGLDSVEVNVE